MGGTRFMNYADVMQYHGESDGNNRYKAVYDQVGAYLTGLNPFGFNENVERLVPYDEAVNLTFLRNIKGSVQTTDATVYDYSKNKTSVMAQGEWNINFATGSATIQGNSMKDIKTIYGILMQSEQTKVQVYGFTDNVGDPAMNLNLSDLRANSVVESLLNMGISVDRFQLVKGKGQADPVATNATAAGRAKNRRVEITLLQ
jgi:outer membrane protein OmpA-like peptidoglycan-associated protein